jgi:outer membrane protein OmpA-like peptidoglycan-associated protein
MSAEILFARCLVILQSWTRVPCPRGVVALTAVALACVLPPLTGCTNRGGNDSGNAASSTAAPGPATLGGPDRGNDEGVVKTQQARAEPATLAPAVAMTKIPLVKGLTVIGAASERQGDYEAATAVAAIEPDGSLHLSTSAEVPDPSGGLPSTVSVTRSVRASDLQNGRTYKYMFYTAGEEEYPGTTAMGTSAAVLQDLRSRGEASVTLDGEAGGIAGMMSTLLGMMPGSDSKDARKGYLTASGTLKLVEPKPVPFRLIVNNAAVSLPAWHVHGRFGEGDEAVDVEWHILDDPDNPLSLRFAFGKEQLEIVRIEFPVENEATALETVLTENKRAVLYGIYFDFNSATIKPQSDAVLRAIVDVMKKDPEWVLVVEGHTDNIGGDARNQELSSRRAAAVKTALVERGVPADRLTTVGYGASVPRETNTTLAGRARNRRVELTRQ